MLAGQIALVTGASRGIGRAIALELGGLGATVVDTATTVEGAAKIQSGLDQAAIAVQGMVLDVTVSARRRRSPRLWHFSPDPAPVM